VAILEEIHGDGNITVIDDVEDILDNSITKDRRQQIDYIVKANHIGEDFAGDPSDEYQRMVAKYGMHTEVRMTNVEKVYGPYRDGHFKKACGVEDQYESMSVAQLRTLCDELGIAYKASDKRTHLTAVIRETKALEAA
jgi:hypothetical protein